MVLFTRKEETLSERIKGLRKKKGLTQLELAGLVHVTDKAVSKWETGEGNPEITILIQLSSIFQVSLDYLLTGKEPEKEVVVISKMELCCKEDNENLFNELSAETIKGKDENGNTILDYIEKYNSVKIFYALIDRFGPSALISEDSSNFRNFGTKRVIELFFKYDSASSLETINFFKHQLSRSQWGDISRTNSRLNNIYVEKNVESMMTLCKDDGAILITALSIHKNETVNNVSDWQTVYNNILYYALLNEKQSTINRTLKTILEINKSSIEQYETKLKEARYDEKSNHRLALKPTNIVSSNYRTIDNYAVIGVPVKTLELLVKSGYIKEVRELNKYNAKFKIDTLPTGLIEAETMKKEGKGSKDDIFIVSCLEYGIVNIDKVLTSNNLEIVKKAFNKYPICFKDMLISSFVSKNYKELYMFAVDNGFDSLAQALLLINTTKYGTKYVEDTIEKVVESIYSSSSKLDVNKKYFEITSRAGYYSNSKQGKRKTSQEVKDEIIKELTLKLDKESAVNGLTKEYFEGLLKANNFELLIIKLCVKLEAILKFDYRFEGTFEEMLKTYSDKHLHWDEDDGWGYMVAASDDKSIKTLNSLRIKRNSIVHSEKTQVELSLDDLKYCIEYICKLGKEA